MVEGPLRIVEGKALSAQQKKDLLNRLARIEGQLRGVQKLIALADSPSDCDAVAQQMAERLTRYGFTVECHPARSAGSPAASRRVADRRGFRAVVAARSGSRSTSAHGR